MFTKIKSQPIEIQIFIVLGLTSCIANLIGFGSNAVLFGFSIQTIVCGICDVAAVVLSIFGLTTKKVKIAAGIMCIMLCCFEFPFLFFYYGKCTMVYLMLGLFCAGAFFSDRLKYLVFSVTLIEYIVVIIYCNANNTFFEIELAGQLGSTICSLVISAVSMFMVYTLVKYQLTKKNAELSQLSEKLESMANMDALTGIYNRRFLAGYVQNLIEDEKTDFAVVLMDLDRFKDVNDRFGHIFGDEVLVNFAAQLRNAAGEYGIAARYGGEEFMLVLKDCDEKIIREILRTVRAGYQEFSLREKNERFTFSGGLEFYNHVDRVTQVFNSADKKLYDAKEKGRNTIVS